MPAVDGINVPDTGGIEAMGLGEVQAVTIPLGPAAARDLHLEACRLQPLDQGPAGAIHGGGVFQGGFGLGLDPS